jgi:galactonate dehydratase
MATPNFVALEYLVDDVPWRDALLTEPLRVEAGQLVVGSAPGLGVELDLDTCRAHPFRPVDRPARRRDDGSVAEW